MGRSKPRACCVEPTSRDNHRSPFAYRADRTPLCGPIDKRLARRCLCIRERSRRLPRMEKAIALMDARGLHGSDDQNRLSDHGVNAALGGKYAKRGIPLRYSRKRQRRGVIGRTCIARYPRPLSLQHLSHLTRKRVRCVRR
jgi:hypothetical protein